VSGTITHVTLNTIIGVAFQRKRVACQINLLKTDMWPKREGTNVERWGLQVQKRAWWHKIGASGMHGVKVVTWHGQ
jgi:hypothetical protein